MIFFSYLFDKENIYYILLRRAQGCLNSNPLQRISIRYQILYMVTLQISNILYIIQQRNYQVLFMHASSL
jgi:hypothetical protein